MSTNCNCVSEVIELHYCGVSSVYLQTINKITGKAVQILGTTIKARFSF